MCLISSTPCFLKRRTVATASARPPHKKVANQLIPLIFSQTIHMEARLDKWLWAARIFKTRSLAADACKNGRVAINGAQAKPSRSVKEGDEVAVRKSPVTYTFKVKQAIEKRVGAKLLPEILENITAPEQYEVLEMSRISGFVGRAKGTGRPTKKDRRALDDFSAPIFLDEDFDFDEEEEEDE